MEMYENFNEAVIPYLLQRFLGTHPQTPSLLSKGRGVTNYISMTSPFPYCLREGQGRVKKKTEIISIIVDQILN